MSTVVITVGGTDITDHVIFASAQFESQLGAIPGAFEFTVRDKDQIYDFTTGSEVTLDIDSTRYFGGYAMQVVRTFAFPVDDTTDVNTVKTREWIIRGVDYNIHFDKRVIYNKATPTSGLPTFSATTTDIAVIAAVFANYLDYSDIGLDITTYVEEVGDPTPTGSAGAYANVGDPWRKQMEQISQFTGAIWYIDAEKNFHYQALETVSPSWSFSDTPNHSTTFGFREFEYIDDATNVVNDALVWGGSPFGSTGTTAQTTFGRAYNNVSAAVVGRWQLAEKHFGEQGFFEDSGDETRAKVIVYGDPGAAGPGLGDQSRGLQNPQKNVKLTWFSDGVPTPLTAGSVVNVYLAVYDDIVLTLPVRSIMITFPNPTSAKFSAFLGIQTSDPWSLWKYLKKANQIATAAAQLPPLSDGTDSAVVIGTRVCAVPTGTINGTNDIFTTQYPYIAGTTEVYLNGLRQRMGASYEYQESDPSTGEINFTNPPQSGDTLWVCFYASGI